MKKVLIRDGSGMVINEVENPAIVFDKNSSVLLFIGEYELMKGKFEFHQKSYREGGFPEMADAVTLMEVPLDQELVDKLFQNSGYVGVYYREAMASCETA